MDYVILAPGIPFNGDTLRTQSLGGSESAAYYMARELAARGHRVTMFTSHPEGGMWDGVTYVHAGEVSQASPLGAAFEFYARNTPHDVLLIQRHPSAFALPFASKINIWQTHDLALHRMSPHVLGMMWNVNVVTCVSAWHKQQLREVYSLPEGIVRVVPNGVDPALYAGEPDVSVPLPCDPGELQLLYQSRPERGLEHLVRPGGIMDRLRGVARLYVCGYDNTTAEMASYYAQLGAWAAALPNVTQLGALTKAQLAGVQRRCDLLCYPTEFEEVSCLTAMEAMHAGLPILTSAIAALPETCAGSGTVLLPLKDGKADEDAFVAEVKRFADDRDALHSLRAAQLDAARSRTWAHACDELDAVVADCFGERSEGAVLRHLMKAGDVATAKALLATKLETAEAATDGNTALALARTGDGLDAIEARTAQEIDALYSFLDSDDAYAAHYARHCGAYYDEHPKSALRRVPEETTRYKGVVMLLNRARQRLGRPLRVLDYGCAHGHYSIGLAKAFPDCEFIGLDLSKRAIEEAIAWAADERAGNAGFARLRDGWETGRTFDVVLLAEVLEHVRDYRGLLAKARATLAADGALITTTPYGPWEWIGHEAYRQAREHWQHFERQDLVELFTGMQHEIICAPAGGAPGGGMVGSWVALVWPGAGEFGTVNRARKLAQCMPEQTVSACLIVKDAANTLRKALDSLVPWVHEVVIGIDPASTDGTPEVIEAFRKANPWLPVTSFAGKRALVDGFDEARNATVERACGDWILWMDADEELVGGDQLTKLLRPNMHQAYACPQIHFSVQPAQVLTTDFPSRLFRNNGRVRFYGCLTPDSEVITNPGVKTLRDIQVGDMVRTHDGSYRAVTRRWSYDVDTDLVQLQAVALPQPLKLTTNHQVLSISTRKCHYDKDYNVRCKNICRRRECGHRYYEHYSPQWTPAARVEVGDWLLYPVDRSVSDVESVSLSSHAKEGRHSGQGSFNAWKLRDGEWRSGRGGRLADRLAVTSGLLRLAGYYVSDGHVSDGGRLAVYFGAQEGAYAADVVQCLRDIGIRATTKSQQNMQIVTARCRPFTEWLTGEFGSGSRDKKAPLWVMRLPVERQREYLRGLWRGDGCVRGSLIRYTTVNRELAAQVRDLLLRDDIVANYQWGAKARTYSVFARVKRRPFLDWQMPDTGPDVAPQAWTDDKYVYHRVKRTRTVPYKGVVMDLTVDGNNSYVANGAIVHNCVHEHPESAPGEAIETAVARHEIQFAHNGYITEDKRRARYFRNLPLLMRDIDEHPDRLLNQFLLIRDLAQGIGFDLQQSGGRPLPDHRARAQRVIDLWRTLLGNPKPVSRMLLDAMQYYTMAAEVLGGAFDVNVTVNVAKPPHQTNLNVQGKFLRPDDLTQLLNRLSKEATANYDSAYF